jgi:hypothetical protein
MHNVLAVAAPGFSILVGGYFLAVFVPQVVLRTHGSEFQKTLRGMVVGGIGCVFLLLGGNCIATNAGMSTLASWFGVAACIVVGSCLLLAMFTNPAQSGAGQPPASR